MGGDSLHHYGLPHATCNTVQILVEYLRGTYYNQEELGTYVHQNVPRITDDQRVVYDAAISAYEGNNGDMTFVNFPGEELAKHTS